MNKKIVRAIIILVVGVLLSLGANYIFAIPTDYVTDTKVVKTIKHDKQNIYFTFEDDKITYSFTEFGDVTSEYVLENIIIGDTITITTEYNIGKAKYTLIHKVEKSGAVIYDSIEYHKNHAKNLKLIFIPSIIIITLFFAINSFIEFGSKNNANKFVIRFPKIVFSFFAFFTLFGFVFPLMFTILLLFGNMPYQTYEYSFVFYIFLALGIIGLVIYAKARLVYDGEYYYVHSLFKKTKKINKTDVKYIVIDRVNKYKKNKSGVYNKKDERIFMVSLELFYCLSNEFFMQSIITNKIKFIEVVLNSKGEIVEKEIEVRK